MRAPPASPANPPTRPSRQAGPARRALPAGAVVAIVLGAQLIAAACATATATSNGPWDQMHHAEEATDPVLDHDRMVDDLRELSSAAYAGRRTGTAGAYKAQQFIAQAFEEAGLRPLGGSFIRPFKFADRSVRAFWEGGRPFNTNYQAANVIGFVPGRLGPGDTLVVSAHFDHLGVQGGRIYYGADDNASGVAALLGLARWFAQHRPLHNVVFAAFDGEELGRHGALAFMSQLPFPHTRIRFNLNMDMVGRSDSGDVYAVGTYQFPELKPLVREVARRSPVLLRTGHDSPFGFVVGSLDWTRSSDQIVFARAGIPFIYLGVENHRDYHEPSDTFERIDQRFFAAVSEVARDLVSVVDAKLDAAALPRAP